MHVGGSTVKQLSEIIQKEQITWRSFVELGNAGTGTIARRWNYSASPTFYLIDHNGVIRCKWLAAPGEKIIDTAIEKLIKEAVEKPAK